VRYRTIRGATWRGVGTHLRGARTSDREEFRARALGFRCVRLVWLRYTATPKGLLSSRTVSARTFSKHFKDKRIDAGAASTNVLQGFRCIRRETT
jgi:hypothetical protein